MSNLIYTVTAVQLTLQMLRNVVLLLFFLKKEEERFVASSGSQPVTLQLSFLFFFLKKLPKNC